MDDDLRQEEKTFVFIDAEAETAFLQEAVNAIRNGNSDINKQLKRDIEMLAQAIVYYGDLESDKIKARTLLKSLLFLYFGEIFYRDSRDKKFYPWNKLNACSELTVFPIASTLLHGSRILIEFSAEISYSLIDWLIMDKSSWRYAATHGMIELGDNEKEVLENRLIKHLKEVKINLLSAAVNLLVNPIAALAELINTSTRYFFSPAISTVNTDIAISKSHIFIENKADTTQHYGINLALGGAGRKNFFSNKRISNNGEHGQLYICYDPGNKKYGGLLLGIEQSAPGKNDQYGGIHNLVANEKIYSASGGDFFFKRPKIGYDDVYVGLTKLPFASYYDSLWGYISNESFILIQSAYKKISALLDLLPEKQSLNFIREIISSSGKATEKDFTVLFTHYFEKFSKQNARKEKIKQEYFDVLMEKEKKDNGSLANVVLNSTVEKGNLASLKLCTLFRQNNTPTDECNNFISPIKITKL